MDYESSHSERRPDENGSHYFGPTSEWINVMPIADEDVLFDGDCPPLESGIYANPVRRFNGRVIPPRESPTDPIDPELLAFMKSLTPYIQMEDDIQAGMPVFRGTAIPIKRIFDCLLAGQQFDDFMRAYPSVPRGTAVAVLNSEATLFYEDISAALAAR